MTSGRPAPIAEPWQPETLPGQRLLVAQDRPMPLDGGTSFGPFHIAYETYGALNADKSNAILICHALTGDQYAASTHPLTGKPGWWELVVGPGRPIDTDRYFVICANVLGGCMGSTGPRDIDPRTGKPYGLSFPVITIADMVRAQALLLDALGIERLFCVIGGSMGAMQALQWAVSYPDRVFACLPIAGAARHSAQNIAFHEVGRQAILADPNWDGGAYYDSGLRPTRGLAVARMAAHITYLSEPALHRKFGRNLQDRKAVSYGFDADFQVESYLRHQGSTFVERFDANAYLYITRAMDYFDIAAEHGGQLANAFKDSPTRFALVSFTSDWLFPTAESREVVHALNAAGAAVSFVEIETDKGHDAFLLDEPAFHGALRGFLGGWADALGLGRSRSNDAAKPKPARPESIRTDLKLIADLVEPQSRVLDVGAGDGALLAYLVAEKGVEGRGLEIDPEEVRASVSRGLPVIQGDANIDLADYPDDAFDYVILSRTIQAMRAPADTLQQLARIGRNAIVSIANFGYWRVRLDLALSGRIPTTGAPRYRWWDSPNIHNCTIEDFLALCGEAGITVTRSIAIDRAGKARHATLPPAGANLFAEQLVFLLRRS